MADDTSTTDASATDDGDTSTDDGLGDAGKKALAAERSAKRSAEKRAADLEAQIQQLQDANKNEAERALDQARKEAAEQASAPLAKELARYKVALAKGLGADDLEFLTGDTEDEMAARADKLLERFGQAKAPAPAFNGGTRTPVAGGDMNDIIRSAMGR
jgi:hypothetical protein